MTTTTQDKTVDEFAEFVADIEQHQHDEVDNAVNGYVRGIERVDDEIVVELEVPAYDDTDKIRIGDVSGLDTHNEFSDYVDSVEDIAQLPTHNPYPVKSDSEGYSVASNPEKDIEFNDEWNKVKEEYESPYVEPVNPIFRRNHQGELTHLTVFVFLIMGGFMAGLLYLYTGNIIYVDVFGMLSLSYIITDILLGVDL